MCNGMTRRTLPNFTNFSFSVMKSVLGKSTCSYRVHEIELPWADQSFLNILAKKKGVTARRAIRIEFFFIRKDSTVIYIEGH